MRTCIYSRTKQSKAKQAVSQPRRRVCQILESARVTVEITERCQLPWLIF